MELGETLEEAVRREITEETGVEIILQGITGVYHNLSSHILCFMFRAQYVRGDLKKQEEEIENVQFVTFTRECVSELITRPHMRSSVVDIFLNQCFHLTSV
ncbi:NUDIX domain-containing protein [Bacillus sp. 165]|nr:NUDIX domain-containing protein [Bacillus sp. 165]